MALLYTCGTDASALGQGATTTSLTLAQVGTDNLWDAISVGGEGGFTLALRGGALWAWGANAYSQLGTNDTVARTAPTQIGAAVNWVKIAAGKDFSLALDATGALFAWGNNASGQLGFGDTTIRAVPTQVGTATDWAKITAGNTHALAIKTTGTLWSWGANDQGGLGQGDYVARSSPTQVGTATDWTAVAAGYIYTLALRGTGTLWAAGNNASYTLGDGTVNSRPSFVQIGTATNWTKIAAAVSSSGAMRADGTLWTWGSGYLGRLGQAVGTYVTTPTQLGASTNWSGLSLSANHVFAWNSLGDLYGAGQNNYGQLGLGTTTEVDTLTLITTDVIQADGGSNFTAALPNPITIVSLPLSIEVYSPIITLPLVIYKSNTSGITGLYVDITVEGTGTTLLGLSIAVSAPNNVVTLVLSVAVNIPGTVILPLPVSVVANKLGQTSSWRPVVTLGGVDISARLTGAIRIEAEEGAARIAEFTLVPSPGAVTPTSWVGVAVTIDYAGQDANGNALYPVRRFTGVVDVPDYDPVRKTTLFHCTDDLQGTLADSSRTALAGLIGGYWSEAALGVPQDNLEYAKERMTTVPASLDMSPWRAPRVTPWAAKSTPDFSLGAGDLVDNSLVIALAYRGLLRNQVIISFGYRYQLARLRVMQFSWAWPTGRQYYDQVSPPYGQTIIDAVTTTGWEILSKVFTTDALYNTTQPEYAPVLSAAVRIGKRYAQTVTEQYGITVSAPLSVAALRANTSQRSAVLEAPWDPTSWEKSPILLNGFSQDSVTQIGFGTASLVLSLVVQGTGPAPPPLPLPPLLTIGTATGEQIQTMTQPGVNDRAASDAAIAALIAAAQVEILASHRGNEVRGTLALAPTLDLIHTLYVSAGGITAQGKLRRLVDRMDMDTGAAITEFTLAISSANATGVQPPTTTPVAPPPPAYNVPNASLVRSWYLNLDTYLGAAPNSVIPYSTGWAGWILNLQPTIKICGDAYLGQIGTSDCAEFFNRDYTPSKLYPVNEFRVFAPGIEDAFRYPSQLTKNDSYTVEIPEDLLTITA